MQIAKLALIFFITTVTFFGTGIIQNSLANLFSVQQKSQEYSPIEENFQIKPAEVEQVILSYIKTKNLNIKLESIEYAYLMKDILLSGHSELTREDSAFVKSDEMREAISSYAWEHMMPLYDGSIFDPRRHPDSNVKKLASISENQQLQMAPLVLSEGSSKAVAYAYLWSQQGAVKRNPAYPDFGLDDCTNFISQAIFYSGEYPMVGGGDGCEHESTFTEWYVNANPYPLPWCLGNFRNWEWSTPWSVPADFREYFAHQSSNAIEIGYTYDTGTAAYYLNPGDVIQIMRRLDNSTWLTFHTMIITSEDSSGVYVTYHSGVGGLDVVDKPLSQIDLGTDKVFMLVQMFREKTYLPLVNINGNSFPDQIINPYQNSYPAPMEISVDSLTVPSTLSAYPAP